MSQRYSERLAKRVHCSLVQWEVGSIPVFNRKSLNQRPPFCTLVNFLPKLIAWNYGYRTRTQPNIGRTKLMFSENLPSYELPPCCDVMGLSNLITVPDWRNNSSSSVVADLPGQFVAIILVIEHYQAHQIIQKLRLIGLLAKPKTVTVYWHLSPDMPPEQLQR